MEVHKTITKEADIELTEILGKDGRIYKDGILNDMLLQSIRLSTTADELSLLFFEKAYIRSGFEIEGDVVKVPCFFSVIEGHVEEFIYQSNDYMRKNKKSIIVQNGFNMLERETVYGGSNYENLIVNNRVNNDVAMDINELSFMKISKRKAFIEAINKVLDWNEMGVGDKIEDIPKFVNSVIFKNKNIIELFHNSDYSQTPPKYVVISSARSTPKPIAVHKLLLMHALAFDVLIVNQKGHSGIENHLSKQYFDIHHFTNSDLKPSAAKVNYDKNKKRLFFYIIITIILIYIAKKFF